MKRISLIFIFASLFFFLLMNCTWNPRSVLPEYYRVIHIPKFTNSTLETDLAELVTEKVIEKFELDARLTVSEFVSKADGILFGNIVKYKKIPLSYTDSGELDTIALTMRIDIKLKDIRSGALLHDTYVEETIKYNLISEPVETELQAQERLIDLLTSKIVSKVIEGW